MFGQQIGAKGVFWSSGAGLELLMRSHQYNLVWCDHCWAFMYRRQVSSVCLFFSNFFWIRLTSNWTATQHRLYITAFRFDQCSFWTNSGCSYLPGSLLLNKVGVLVHTEFSPSATFSPSHPHGIILRRLWYTICFYTVCIGFKWSGLVSLLLAHRLYGVLYI